MRPQVPEAVFVKLVRYHGQQPFTVMLRGEGAIAVALAHELEVAVEGANGRAFQKLFIDPFALPRVSEGAGMCMVWRGLVSVSVRPSRRSAIGTTRDAGHHSRFVQGVDCSPALYIAVALRWPACWHSAMRKDH
ncbi:MAG: hypothetical protein Q7U28_02970 [Aquabacterium sp.]|nr:hypothetical protein [Aquabacterium sp.]